MISLEPRTVTKAGVYRDKSATWIVGEPVVALYRKAVEAFISPAVALEWMQTEQGGLNGRKPVDLAVEPGGHGLHFAEDESLRLVHGILA